jgi:hypothetical protein
MTASISLHRRREMLLQACSLVIRQVKLKPAYALLSSLRLFLCIAVRLFLRA